MLFLDGPKAWKLRQKWQLEFNGLEMTEVFEGVKDDRHTRPTCSPKRLSAGRFAIARRAMFCHLR